MLPSQALRASVHEELRLRRVPDADHRDPDGPPPPPTPIWERRTLTRIGRDHYLLTVPCPGLPGTGGVNGALTDRLRDRWLRANHAPWQITSVVAAVGPRPGRLTLALTATVNHLGPGPLDSSWLLRDLTDALSHF